MSFHFGLLLSTLLLCCIWEGSQGNKKHLLIGRPIKKRLSALIESEVLANFPRATRLGDNVFVVDSLEDLNTNTILATMRYAEEIIACGHNAVELLAAVRDIGLVLPDKWGLSFESTCTVRSQSASQRKEFSSRSLLCCIAQMVTGSVALDPREVSVDMTVYETEHGLYLCRRSHDFTIAFDALEELWNRRPFQYSAALALDISVPLVSMLRGELLGESGTLLDPCCGSGTNLMVARR